MTTMRMTANVATSQPTKIRGWGISLFMFAIATVGEFLALTGWFVFHQANPPIASSFYEAGDPLVGWIRHPPPWLAGLIERAGDFLQSPHGLIAVLVLWAGFIVERLMVVIWLNVPKRIITPGGQLRSRTLVLAGVTLAEIVVWVVWILVAEAHEPAFGTAVLFVGIHLVHSYEVALIKHRQFTPVLVSGEVVFLTILEAVGGAGALWLATRGWTLFPLLLIGLALLIEHIAQVTALKRDAEAGLG
jgi:hypothetical protein